MEVSPDRETIETLEKRVAALERLLEILGWEPIKKYEPKKSRKSRRSRRKKQDARNNTREVQKTMHREWDV